MPYFKITTGGITDKRILMILFLWTGVYQPVPVAVRTGPAGLAPPIAQNDNEEIAAAKCSGVRPSKTYGAFPDVIWKENKLRYYNINMMYLFQSILH